MEPFSIYLAQKSKSDSLCGDCCTTFTHGENIVLLVVDGVSTCNNDNLASNETCRLFKEFFQQSKELPSLPRLSEAVKQISNILKSTNFKAVAIFVIFNSVTGKCFYSNIGDTRLYHYNGQEITQLTEDDSVITPVYRDGKQLVINGSPVTTNKGLSRLLGADKPSEPIISEMILGKNESLILVTDGITGNGTILPPFFDFIHKSDPSKEINNLTIECSNSNRDDATMMLFRRNDIDDCNLTELNIKTGERPQLFFGHAISSALHNMIVEAIQKENNDAVLKILMYAKNNTLDIFDLDSLLTSYYNMKNAQPKIFNFIRDLLRTVQI